MRRVVKNGTPGSRQAYQNKSKFNPNRYKQEKDRISKDTEFVMTSLCCRRCCEIIQWKVDYGKYVAPDLARRCNLCHEKKVSLPFHRICQQCAESSAICAKCQKSPTLALDNDKVSESDEESVEMESSATERHKYDFVDLPIEDAELQHLRGLDVRVLKQQLRRKREADNLEALSALRERERRTVLRKAVVKEEDVSDSDESL